MSLEEKIRDAQQFVTDCLAEAANPVMCISFGKDSMVMLDLVQRMGHKLPIIYWKREHHFPVKNAFANRMIEKYDLSAYDYPPQSVKVVKSGDKIEVVNYYQVAKDKTIAVPTGIVPPKEGEKWLCGLKDMYLKPTGSFKFPWDCMFIGHKNTDVDPIQGAMPLLTSKVIVAGGPTICYPVRFFTDADIWEYSKTFDVPQDLNRYKEGGEDMAFNNDYYPACTACMNPDRPAQVWCPQIERPIDNLSRSLNWVDADSLRHPYWGKGN